MKKTRRSRGSAAAATKLVELGIAAPQVIAHRVTRMALAGPTPNRRDRKEFTGMVVEKQVAFAQAWMAAMTEAVRWQQQLALSLMTGASPRQHAARAARASTRIANAALTPVHRKATANARRLAHTKLR